MRYIITALGCKVNQYEAEAMELLLKAHGHSPAARGEADAVILHSCAVTGEGERKARQTARRLLKDNPNAVLCVSGCWSQIAPEAAREIGARVVFGTGDTLGFVEAIEAAVKGGGEQLSIPDNREKRPYQSLPAGAYAGHARAYLKIEDGCDNYCAYCIIPYARGHVRSLPVSECAEQYAALAAQGYREIVLTGIEIASYGRDLEGVTLMDALEAMGKAAPAVRMHLGSLEPRVITEDFAARLQKLNVCPHFHLSLQSGSNATLRRMKRRYDTALFLEVCERLRRFFPHCSLTTDLICGFPGESEEEFAETLSFIRRCDFAAMHIFPYSVRPGTLAEKLPGKLPAKTKNERAAAAIAAADEMERAYLQSCVGSTLSVLFETEEDGSVRGHAENYTEVRVPLSGLRGQVLDTVITGVEGKVLLGRLL